MDPVHSILLEALRTAARDGGELRLYRSGKLPGLLPARTTAHVQAATQAVRDGLIEVVRTETRGKTTVEFIRVTPAGVDFVLRHDSPARAMDELRDVLALNADHLPAWIAGLRQELDTLSRRMLDEVTRIGQRLDRLAAHVETVLQQAAQEQKSAPAPWTGAALEYLAGRHEVTSQTRCPLPELFAALHGRNFDLAIKDFHAGLRRLREERLVQLLPHVADSGPPEPEFALPDGPGVLYYVALANGTGDVTRASS
jgi:hypothetical protein